MEQQGDDMTLLLPEDTLAAVLGRLAPRGVATSRCVYKAWRDIIDARRILHADLLPHSLAGIFINFRELGYSEFFCRPPPSKGRLGVRERIACGYLEDHCNGLVLIDDWVTNPVTGWEATLPPRPPPSLGMECLHKDDYLVFDPATSPHFQVFLIPRIPYIGGRFSNPMYKIKPAMLESEWPPSSYVLRVFSSVDGRWEEKTFIRQGPSAGTIADLGTGTIMDTHGVRHAVYWRGALYVHREKYFVIRLSLSKSTYQVIKPPAILQPGILQDCFLGKSKKGVYYVRVTHPCQLQVWFLKESCGFVEWALEHDRDLSSLLLPCHQQVYGPWILQDVNYNENKHTALYNDNESTPVGVDFEWNSDDEAPNMEAGMVDKVQHNGGSLLRLHPFKEIVFLNAGLMSRGLAYHLNTSKIEDLGNIYPKDYHHIAGPCGDILAFFPYTPCWME